MSFYNCLLTLIQIIRISGSASLYYIVKNDDFKGQINLKMKKKILSTLLNGMFAHKSDSVMMRNGCLTLCQFTIPDDVVRSTYWPLTMRFINLH